MLCRLAADAVDSPPTLMSWGTVTCRVRQADTRQPGDLRPPPRKRFAASLCGSSISRDTCPEPVPASRCKIISRARNGCAPCVFLCLCELLVLEVCHEGLGLSTLVLNGHRPARPHPSTSALCSLLWSTRLPLPRGAGVRACTSIVHSHQSCGMKANAGAAVPGCTDGLLLRPLSPRGTCLRNQYGCCRSQVAQLYSGRTGASSSELFRSCSGLAKTVQESHLTSLSVSC